MLLFSCGPTKCIPSVLKQQSVEMIHHRSNAFQEIYASLLVQMKQLADCHDGEVLFLNGSGSSGMEAALLNVLRPNEELLVIRTGRFSKRFSIMAKRMGCIVYELHAQNRMCTKDDLTQIFLHHPSIKAIAFTYSDTSTAILTDPIMIGHFAHEHDLISIMDGVGGILMNPFSMQDSQIDICILASQKGFGMSAGLCPVILSHNVISKLRDDCPSYVFHFQEMLQKQAQDYLLQYTPAVSLYMALHQACCLIHKQRVHFLNHAYQIQYEKLCLIIKEAGGTLLLPTNYSRSVILFQTSHSAKKIQEQLEFHQIRIELGLEDRSDRILRIGNMVLYQEVELNRLKEACFSCFSAPKKTCEKVK